MMMPHSLLPLAPDGKYVVSASNDDTVRVWEVITGKEIARMTHDGDFEIGSFQSRW